MRFDAVTNFGRAACRRNKIAFVLFAELPVFEIKLADCYNDEERRFARIREKEGGRTFCMCVARQAGLLSFLHLDSLLFSLSFFFDGIEGGAR